MCEIFRFRFDRRKTSRRTKDRDNFLTSLFVPIHSRNAFFAIRAFHAELGSVRSLSRGNASAAGIRLAYWRDMIQNVLRDGNVTDHPIGIALHEASMKHDLLPRWFERAIEARSSVLDENTALMPPTLGDAEDYADSVWGSSLFSVLECLSVTDDHAYDAASCVGRSLGLVALIRSIAIELGAGNKVTIPEGGYGLTSEMESPDDLAVLSELLCTRANDYLHDAQINIEKIGDKTSQRRACIAMLPSLVGKRFIHDLSKIEYEIRAKAILRQQPVFSLQFSMLRSVLTRKIY